MQGSNQRLDTFALLSAVIAVVVVLVVEMIEDITFTEDCLLYLAVFLTLDRVTPYRVR